MSLADDLRPSATMSELVRIRPTQPWNDFGWGELWQHRELIYFMLWRDLKGRYRQTVLGVVWAVLSPVLNTVIFSVMFGALADGAATAWRSYAQPAARVGAAAGPAISGGVRALPAAGLAALQI